MASTVTLDRAYFETLLRRAQFVCAQASTRNESVLTDRRVQHTDGVDYTTPVHLQTVTISKNDHDSLLRSAREYGMDQLPHFISTLLTSGLANLRRNLIEGGIAEETLAILLRDVDASADTKGGTTSYSATDELTDSDAWYTQKAESTAQGTNANGQDYTFGRNANYTPRGEYGHQSNGTRGFDTDLTDGVSNSYNNHSLDGFASSPHPTGYFDASPIESRPKSKRSHFAKFCKRTILLSNLAEGTTHADITEAVRGGMLLDIFLRSNDRSVSISFLQEAAARDFFRFVKRHDLYIRGKRVEVRWNDRQFILPGHIANQVSIGATRNLVIQNCSPKHSEAMIRDDLEHIHNLVIIKVTFRGQNCYVSTNSVHNSMFARTCMMSRAVYKGSKIAWDADECAAPINQPGKFCKEDVLQKKPDSTVKNRFQLLNMDDDKTSQEEEEFDVGIHVPGGILASG
ncbi:hypothetical protein JHW43_001120 [Diplocarpon mali]|nr:hypothetical protein JHW43_001120 [Diplocarpon mali]